MGQETPTVTDLMGLHESSSTANEDRVRFLIKQLSDIEAELAALLGGVDSVFDESDVRPILLREAQAELAASEARYDRLVKAMSAVVFELTADGQMLLVNDAITPILGYSPAELQGQGWWEMLLPEDQRYHAARLAAQLQVSDVSCYELVLAARHGGQVVLELNTANQYRPDGTLERIVGIATDITERKQAEAAVQEHSERLRIVHEIDRAILAARDPAAIAKAAIDRVTEHTGAVRASVGLFDTDQEQVEVLAIAGAASEEMPVGSRWPFSTIWRIDETRAGQVVTIPDLDQVPDTDPQKAPRLRLGVRSVTFIPMIVEERVIGSLTFAWKEAGSVPPDFVNLAVHVADSLAIAIQNSRLIQQLTAGQRDLAEANQRLRMLNEIDRAVLAASSKEEIAGVTMQRIREIWPCHRASVLLYDNVRGRALVLAACAVDGPGLAPGQSLPLELLRMPPEHLQGRGHMVRDLAGEHQSEPIAESLLAQGIRSHLSLPLLSEGKLIGSLNLSSRLPGAFDDSAVEAIEPVAASLAVALQSARMVEDVRTHQAESQALSRRLLSVQEDERRRLARELHDETGQYVTALSLGIGALLKRADCPPIISSRLREYQAMVSDLARQLHELVSSLRPSSLDRAGLVAAVAQHVTAIHERHGLVVQFTAEGLDERLPAEIETTIYRLVQEALTNVVRHAQASEVRVQLERRDHTVTAAIEDNGVGFDVDEAIRRGRFGLLGMRERAEMIGGRLSVESQTGHGTRVHVTTSVDNV